MRVNVSQRQVTLFMLAIQFIGAVLVLLLVLLAPGSNLRGMVIVGAAVLLFGSMLVAYWYGWQGARYVVIVAISLLVAVSLRDPATSTPPLTLALPPLIALVLAGPAWVIGSGILQLGVLLIRSGGEGFSTNPLMLTVYAMIISGPVLSRLITDSRQREVEAARVAAEEHIQELAQKSNELKQAEITLQQANDQLEARVQERTAALADANEELRLSETHLRQASREAERANAAKNEFLSRMSHELRTPLNAILGFAQLLEMDQLPPEQSDSVDQILKGGKHLLGLIDEVLDISRMEEGRLSVSLEPVELGQIVRECIGMVRPLAAQRNLALNVRLGDAWDVHILADRQRLKQVLVNLLANAVKYNTIGGRVTLAASVVAGARIRITVEDTGPGIPADKLERLFTPFDRLGAEQTQIEGTGLGLALSQRLVKLMGGTIGVASESGQGTTFWIDMPQVDSPIDELANGTAHIAYELLSSETNSAPIQHKILYIEDNLSNLRLLQRILTHRPQIELVTAMQGRLGLDLARVHQPDLIYLDLHLPDISGHEVLDQLQADPRTRDIPIIVVSADATPRQVERLLAAGARAYLTKPLDVRQFFSVLDATLMPTAES